MASDKNKLTIEGNLVRDPERKETKKGTYVSNFCIASNRYRKVGDEFEKETSFFDVQCWANTAEYVYQSLHKGSPVEIEGRIEQQRWIDKASGNSRSRIIIVAESVTLKEREKRNADNSRDNSNSEECPF